MVLSLSASCSYEYWSVVFFLVSLSGFGIRTMGPPGTSWEVFSPLLGRVGIL